MASCEVWDVVKVPFPYTNRPVQQHRPALVISRYDAAGSPALLWVLMITRAEHRRWNGDVDIADLTAAGLPVPSIVRSTKIATIEASEAIRIGCLAVSDRSAVHDQLADMLEPALVRPS